MTIRRASRVLVYGVLSLSVVSVVSRIFSALTTIILARFLGPNDYGLWGLSWSVFGFFGLAGMIPGIGSAVIKFVSQYDAEGKPSLVRKVAMTGLKVKIVLGLTIGLSAFILAPFVAENLMNLPQLTILIRLLAVNYVVTCIRSVDSVLTGLKKFHIIALFTAFERILFFLFSSLVLLSGLGLIGLAMGNLASYVILTVAVLIVVFTKYIPRSEGSSVKDPVIGLLKKMIAYGMPAALGSLIMSFYNDFTVFSLGIWTAPASVGLFGAAKASMDFLFITPMSFVAAVLFPLTSEMHAKKQIEDLRRFISLVSKHLLFFTCYMATFTWFFASELMVLIYSTDFEASAFYLQILTFLPMAAVWTQLADNVILGTGYSKLAFKLNAIYVISGIVLVLLIVPAFGVVGACLLQVFLQYLIALLYVIYTKRIVGNFLDSRAYIKSVPPILICLMLMFCIKSLFAFQLSNLILSLILLICIFSLGLLLFYSILCLTGGIRRSEISLLSEIFSTSPIANILKPIISLLNLLTKLTHS